MKHILGKGELYIWLSGAFLAFSIIMIGGMLVLITLKGAGHFAPLPITRFQVVTADGDSLDMLGQVFSEEPIPKEVSEMYGYESDDSPVRFLVRIGNRERFGQDFKWINAPDIRNSLRPANAVCMERTEYGNAYGFVEAINLGADRRIENEVDAWDAFAGIHEHVLSLTEKLRSIEKYKIGDLNYVLEEHRLRALELQYDLANHAIEEAEFRTETGIIAKEKQNTETLFRAHQHEIDSLRKIAAEYVLTLRIVGGEQDGETMEIPVASIVRAYKPNVMTLGADLEFYAAKTWEFLFDDPREANAEGGVFPAIFGTVMMVLLMTIAAVPFGVLSALYLREYATEGPFVRTVRIAVNNLAGVPSIVFGMFGLGFFVYFIGGNIDALFFPERLPNPTYGTGGILWASLTLALLTVPVVIVATEEALAAIPRGMREGSLALGATKWETIRRVVLPTATPGIMTGAILAMARGAGEVAPLMITGVVKLATEMPFDSHFPFFHLDRKFMHLGFHIYDVGFQTSNVEANIGMVYTTTLLLLVIILLLNLAAIIIRAKLRRKYRLAGF
ncbi:MAG TPA: phosphate ABC transporter permease PstA [Bacteroidota bacterium]